MTSTRDLLAWLAGQQDAMVALLRALVEHESPSTDKAALDALARRLRERFAALPGAQTQIHSNIAGGDHLSVRFPGPAGQRPGLVIGHFDTVWAMGTLQSMPFRVENGRAWGPGVCDMKAGIVQAEFALRALLAAGAAPPRPLHLLLTSDEEVGSATSRPLIETAARDAAYALVLEPPLPNGALKTARKGVGRFTLRVEGRAAHAGVAPELGASAILELAHQIVRIHALNDRASGLTLNVGVVRGGTRPNVVAAEAEAEVDVRVATLGQASAVEAALRGLAPVTAGTRIAVSGGFNRPPMERTPAIAALFERARALGAEIGLELEEGSTGGGSDGNFTAAVGCPTLDGLGVPGDGAHAPHEQVDLAALPARAAILAGLLLTL